MSKLTLFLVPPSDVDRTVKRLALWDESAAVTSCSALGLPGDPQPSDYEEAIGRLAKAAENGVNQYLVWPLIDGRLLDSLVIFTQAFCTYASEIYTLRPDDSWQCVKHRST